MRDQGTDDGTYEDGQHRRLKATPFELAGAMVRRCVVECTTLWLMGGAAVPCHGDEGITAEVARLRGLVVDDYDDQANRRRCRDRPLGASVARHAAFGWLFDGGGGRGQRRAGSVRVRAADVVHLLGLGRPPDPDGLLRRAADDATRQAEKLAAEASRDLDRLPADAARRREEARIYRRYAEQALDLVGHLKPYLVRGVVLTDGSRAGFDVYVDSARLWVEHRFRHTGSRYRPPMKRRPIVVFLERAPTSVEVSLIGRAW